MYFILSLICTLVKLDHSAMNYEIEPTNYIFGFIFSKILFELFDFKNQKQKILFLSFKIDTYLSRISSLSWIGGEKDMGIYIRIQKNTKEK